jgi:hypothetical protein
MQSQANDQAPNMTHARYTAEELAGMTGPDALRALAAGEYIEQGEIQRLSGELRVVKRKATAVILAMAKRFTSLESFVTADQNARQAAIARYTGKGNAKTALKAMCDSSYLTACDQIRSAAGVLGWEAIQQAETIGGVYAKAKPKVAKAKPDTDKGDVMPDRELPDTTSDKVHNLIVDLAEALSVLPEADALGIVQNALMAALLAGKKAG